MGSNDSKYLTHIFRIPAEAPRRRFGAAASQRRRLHAEGKAPGSPLARGDVFPPWSLALEKPTSAHVGKRRGWPWVWSPPGPLGQASFQTSVFAQVRWGLSASKPATPLGLGFGFRVQTGLHSSEEANSGIIKAGEINKNSQPGPRPAVPEAATRGASGP